MISIFLNIFKAYKNIEAIFINVEDEYLIL